MEEETGPTTTIDTQMPTIPGPLDTLEKRLRERMGGGQKKAKAHKPQFHISLTLDDVELVATTNEEILVEVWENAEKHRYLIADQVQAIKILLEQIRIRVA
jgi:hypothetical protein